MMTSKFRELLESKKSVFNDDGSKVISFGDATAEFQATQNNAALFVVTDLIRIQLTGADRAKFLHNFCTGNVNAMEVGDVVEAFLTDVKARILGHGYVTKSDENIELWMLAGAADQVVKHLQKYMIIEDVKVQMMTPCVVVAVAGPQALDIYSQGIKELSPELSPEPGHCTSTEIGATISVTWNGQPLILSSLASDQQVIDAWQALDLAGAKPAGEIAFEALRIAERFPKVDVDLSNANMAPEAGRNDTAICYTKGCYLGQEPIARLDAMGHVNRQLYSGSVAPHPDQASQDFDKWPLVTSLAAFQNGVTTALAVLPVKLANSSEPVACRSADGRLWELTVTATDAS